MGLGELNDAATFARTRSQLLGLGYRLTGTWADAEEVADEALTRLVAQEQPPRNAQAWLTTVTTRLCLTRLRRRGRESYIGPWLPEPIDEALIPDETVQRREDLRLAVLAAYECLTPNERGAFVLREAYQLPYDEIAEALDAQTATVRQWASRARRKLDGDLAPPAPASDKAVDRLVNSLLAGDLDATCAALTEDARIISDGGGRVRAARREIVGARKCAYFLIKTLAIQEAAPTVVLVNGQPAFALRAGGVTRVVQVAEREGRIDRVYILCNPEKQTRIVHQVTTTP